MEGRILWMKIPLDYSYAGLDIQEKHFRTHLGTLQVVSFLAFLPENASGMHSTHLYAPCDIIDMKTTPPSGRAHPQLHCVKFWSKSHWRFLRYSNFCILPLSCFFPIWPLSVTQHLRHGLRTDTNTTITHHPVCPGHCRCYCQCADG